jgi:hypothetical protein
MALPIIERPLYGEVLIETSPWANPFVWTDRTAQLVNGVNYSQGGRVGAPGSSQVDVGTLNATFKNLATVPAVGALVRISFSKFAGYAFVGYIENVSQQVVFDNSLSLNTPITLTTLHCIDWVGYVSQFQLVGAGGANFTTGVNETDSLYGWNDRVAAINKIVDATYATKIVSAVTSGAIQNMGDTDLVANISNHLDLITSTANTYWYPRNVLPTNITTGRTGLVEIRSAASLVSSGKTFTDVLGTAGQLHYTEIDIENTSQNVANTVVINNRSRVHIYGTDITRIGGFNETNFMVINNQNVVGVALDTTEKATDATSIGIYGNRQTEIETNIGLYWSDANLVANPSAEYSDDGYTGLATAKVRRRKPSEEPTPFAAYNGQWALRSYQSVAAVNAQIRFTGGESDGTPVTAPAGAVFPFYRFDVQVARGTPSRTDARFVPVIDWQNDDETTISSSTGASVNLTTANTWYTGTIGAFSPVGATRAVLRVIITRSGGGNQFVGDRYWADSFNFYYPPSLIATSPYFDGDTPWDATYGYLWTGGVGSSPSLRVTNELDNVATLLLSQYSTTSLRVSRIRWNCQEDLTSVPALSVGKTISIIYKGTTTTHRIVGIDGNIDPERYMLDFYLVKV